MNNLKRVLSLGLVGAMLSGMMIMGAGAAAYTDVDDIEHIEAVETMGSLNIINGKDDGSFDPDGFVTRAEMAKMIAVAMNGGKEPNFGTKTTSSFTDIKGHWAETFIEYCYDMNIINGRGDGTFDPSGNVTGVEAAKMVLSALGYDAVAYLLTGANWDSNVNRNATQVCQPSLYDTVTNVTMAQPITRDVAAQIIWNGLQNETREINPDTVVSTGEVTNQYRRSGRTFLEVHYDAKIGYGILADNDKTDTSLTNGHIKLTGFALDTDDINSTAGAPRTVNFPWDTNLDWIGEKVKVIFKDGQQGRKNNPDYKDTIYGVYNANETQVVRDIVANVKNTEKNNKYVLNIGGTEYNLATDSNGAHLNVEVRRNFLPTTETYDADDQKCFEEVKSGSTVTVQAGSVLSRALKKDRGDTVKAVMNDKNEITTIYVTESTLQQVTAVSSDKVTITNVGTIKKADNDIYDGVAKDDMVVVTTLYNSSATNEDAFNIVEKAEVVTGEIGKFKGTENVTVDGETYKIRDKAASLRTAFGSKFIAAVEAGDGSNRIGKEVELYMVNGYVDAIKLVSTDASNYSVVMAIRTNGAVEDIFDDLKLQVMGADGTKTIISVADDSQKMDKSDVTSPEDFKKGDIVTYDLNKDGTATVYIKAKAVTAANGATYDKDTKSVVWGGKTYVTAADCVLFVDSGEGAATPDDPDEDYVSTEKNSWKAYTIRNLGDVNTTARYAVALDSDNKVVAVSLRAGTPAGAGAAKVYGMVTADNGTYKIDGTTYRQFVISVNGEEYVVNQKRTSFNDAADVNKLAKGRIVGFEPTSDNVYESTTDFKVVAHGVRQGTANETPVAVYVKEYNPSEGIITVYTGRSSETVNSTTTYKGEGSKTYAVDDDVKMYYVDTDGDTAMESATVSTFNTMTGYKSAYLVLDENNIVIAIIAEVSGEASVEAGSPVTSPVSDPE